MLAENTARRGGVLAPVPSRQIRFGTESDEKIAGTDNKLGDHIYGAGGDDTIDGLSGDDLVEGNQGSDQLWGGGGNDTLVGGEGRDSLVGGAGGDSLLGGGDNDELDGGEGSDVLSGGDGDDVLDGGTGNDTLKGGDGNDTYVFAAGWGKDTITDTDGKGSIQVAEYGTLNGEGAIKDGEGQWHSADGRVLFTLISGSGGNALDISFRKSAVEFEPDTIRIANWSSGDLGINLGGTVAPPATSDDYVGDFEKLVQDGAYVIVDHNYVSGAAIASAIAPSIESDRVTAADAVPRFSTRAASAKFSVGSPPPSNR